MENPKGGVRGVISDKQKYSVTQESETVDVSRIMKKEKSYTLDEKEINMVMLIFHGMKMRINCFVECSMKEKQLIYCRKSLNEVKVLLKVD